VRNHLQLGIFAGMKSNERLRVLFVTYYWPPSGGAGVQRCLKFVKYLSEFGIDPVVVTVDPKQASYAVRDESLLKEIPANVQVISTNTWEPFELYKKLLRKKEIPFGGFANTGRESFTQKLMKFIRGNLFIPDARVGWNRHALKACRKIIREQNIQAIITSSPPHSTQLIGLKLKREFGLPWIADLRDPWTDIYFYKELQHTRFSARLDARYEREVLETADALVTVSADLKRLFEQKSKAIPSDKIHVLPNGFDETDFEAVKEKKGSDFLITYTGTITERYGADVFFRALAQLKQKHPQLAIRLRMVGVAAAGVQASIDKAGLAGCTEMLPYVPHERSVAYLKESTVLLLAIPQVENNRGILTGKLFEYLAARKPILAIGPVDGDAATIIHECQAGQLFDYKDEIGILSFLEKVLVNWQSGQATESRSENYRKYSRRSLTQQLASVLNQLIQRR
jgi:glycosyltransferase involved in cell wall biosynthesis